MGLRGAIDNHYRMYSAFNDPGKYEGDCAHVLAFTSTERNRAAPLTYSSSNPMTEHVGISYQRIPGFLYPSPRLRIHISTSWVCTENYTHARPVAIFMELRIVVRCHISFIEKTRGRGKVDMAVRLK